MRFPTAEGPGYDDADILDHLDRARGHFNMARAMMGHQGIQAFLPAFQALTGLELSTVTESEIIQPKLYGPFTISISGGSGEYSLSNDGIAFDAYTSTAGTITNGQYVKVRGTSSASILTLVETTLTVSKASVTTSSTFRITTREVVASSVLWADDSGVLWADTAIMEWAS